MEEKKTAKNRNRKTVMETVKKSAKKATKKPSTKKKTSAKKTKTKVEAKVEELQTVSTVTCSCSGCPETFAEENGIEKVKTSIWTKILLVASIVIVLALLAFSFYSLTDDSKPILEKTAAIGDTTVVDTFYAQVSDTAVVK